ncbi:MAG: sodium/solute symporter [Candidatus Acidoferrales bacterium]
MNWLDFTLVGGYVLFLIGLAYYFSLRQQSQEDYYLGGRTIPWWASGLSTMATQLGTISFVSAPAFVALKDVGTGGGLGWLTYEFGVPLALVFIMIFLLPVYHRARVISIYEYLEKRFDGSTRVYVSLLFQISRGLATGVAVYTIGFVIAIFFGEVDPGRVWPYIIAIGIITVIYDAIGGIKMVIWSDVIQMTVLAVGILALAFVAYTEIGGFAPLLGVYADDPERFRILNFSWGYGEGQQYAFWPMLLGGLFLYISYYGCDQSQVQRELSVGSSDDVRRSLLLNAFGRFPLVLLYCFMGLLLGSFTLLRPDFRAQIPAEHLDWMVPLFIVEYLPHGLIGFIFIGILAAAMSSLDSALNSMSAATMRDLYQPYFKPQASQRHYLIVSKLFTVFWGVFTIIFAFIVPAISETVLEAINKVGSLLYGPIFAAFLLGILTRWATPLGVKLGVSTGIALNLFLWLGVPELSWLWWNAAGLVAAVATALVVSKLSPRPAPEVPLDPREPTRLNWPLRYLLVTIYFFGIIAFCAYLQTALSSY